MLTNLKTIVRRNHANLVGDAIGAVSLVVILMAGLHLPTVL